MLLLLRLGSRPNRTLLFVVEISSAQVSKPNIFKPFFEFFFSKTPLKVEFAGSMETSALKSPASLTMANLFYTKSNGPRKNHYGPIGKSIWVEITSSVNILRISPFL